MTKNNQIVADALKNSGLKQIEFAERIGVSRSHLSAICLGHGKASDALTELVRLKFINQPLSVEEEEAMYRVKYEKKCEEVIELQKVIIDLKTTKKARPLGKKKLA